MKTSIKTTSGRHPSWRPHGVLFFILLHFTIVSFAQKFDPGPNKTILLVGQTFQNEYQGYVNGVGTKPAGSSHYGTLYLGTIEQGDDNPNAVFLDWVRNYQSNPYALVAISVKDNTAAGGYGQMVNPSWPGFNANAVHDALVAINNGQWDTKIDAYAGAFAARPDVKFFLRVEYEVSLLLFAYNGTQYFDTWLQQKAAQGINVFENPDAIPELDRSAYINAYNRIANRIKSIASNVAFVYHPVRGYNDTRWLYPGDTNVDYVGFSIFNNDVCMEVNGTFNCQGQSIDPQLQQSINFAKQHNKAIMVAESAVQAPASRTPSEFNLYLTRLNNLITANDVKVLSYINSNWTAHGWDNSWGDSRVEVNTTVKNHWTSIFLGSRYVQGSGSSNGLPTGWLTTDIGGVGATGSASHSNGTYTVNGSGVDIWGTADEFRYAFQNRSGNVRITAKVNSLTNTNPWAKAGVMIRENNTTGSRYGMMMVTAGQGTSYQRRTSTNGTSVSTTQPGNTVPEWIRLERIGNTFTGYRSEDGNNWTQVATGDVTFGTDATVGLAVTSHNDGVLASASFSNVTVENIGGSIPATPNNLTVTATSSSQINLTWTDNAGNESGFYIERAIGSGTFSQIASVSANTTSYSNTGLTASTNYIYRVRAYNTGGNSGYSNTANATTPSGTSNCAGNCPAGYTLFLCGQCWVDQAQATSGGCTETCSGGTGVPGAPANLSASAVNSTQINLSWTDNASNENGFYVERSTSGGNFIQIATVASNITSYNNTGLTASTNYNFRVRAYNGTGTSLYSNTASATTTNSGGGTSGKFVPPSGKTLMIIGQDLASVTDYVNSGFFPTPGGITTYVAFYDILNASARYGALGIDLNDQPQGQPLDLDWGGGPLNAYSAAVAWPNSTLQMGLNIAEGNNGSIWCNGCLAQLANGQRNAEIIQLADFFKKIAKPVYLRIGYEFDGKWNDGYQNKTNYINAFRRIVTVLRQQNVTNVAYVWQSCASPIDDILENTREDISTWYPGNTYVDWVGISWFLLPNETPPVGGTPASQLILADETVNFARANGKPVMIAESTPQGYNLQALTNANISPVWDGAAGSNVVGKSAAQVWSEWYAPFFNYIHSNSDAIRAVSYINANWNAQGLWAPPYTQGYWGDTRMQVNSTLRTNWQNELNASFWIHGSSSLFSQLNGGGRISTKTEKSIDDRDVEFYPNPNRHGMLLSSGTKAGIGYTIYSTSGKELFQGTMQSDNASIDISKLPQGVYIISIKNNGTILKKKIVVE